MTENQLNVVAFTPESGGGTSYIVRSLDSDLAVVVDLSVNTAIRVREYLSDRGLTLAYRLYTHGVDDGQGESDGFLDLVRDLGLTLDEGTSVATLAHDEFIQSSSRMAGPITAWSQAYHTTVPLVTVDGALYELDHEERGTIHLPADHGKPQLTGHSVLLTMDEYTEVEIIPLSGVGQRVAYRAGNVLITGCTHDTSRPVPQYLVQVLQRLDPGLELALAQEGVHQRRRTIETELRRLFIDSGCDDVGCRSVTPAGSSRAIVGRVGEAGTLFIKPRAALARLDEFEIIQIDCGSPGRLRTASCLTEEQARHLVQRTEATQPLLLVSREGTSLGDLVHEATSQSTRMVYVLDGGLRSWLRARLPLEYPKGLALAGTQDVEDGEIDPRSKAVGTQDRVLRAGPLR